MTHAREMLDTYPGTAAMDADALVECIEAGSSPGRRPSSQPWSGQPSKLAPRLAVFAGRNASATPERWTWSTVGCVPMRVGAAKRPATGRFLPSAHETRLPDGS
jgi:hypothetical protein